MPAELLYGRNAVMESLRARRRGFARLMHAPNLGHDDRLDEIYAVCKELNIPVDEVQRGDLESRVDTNHQGVVLECDSYPVLDEGELLDEDVGRDAIFLALDSLQDPRNVGSLLRTAEAVGVAGVAIPTDRAASITPAVSNASAGAVEHLRVAQVTNLVRWLEAAKASGAWITGLEGSTGTPSIFDTDVPLPAVLVVGSEGTGLRRLVAETCDITISIPMHGRVESLNAAVAGSIALYEIREFAESS